jgi:hypothetical protein
LASLDGPEGNDYGSFSAKLTKSACYIVVVLNTAVWLDARTAETVDAIIAKVPGRNQDYLRVNV